MRIKSTLAQLIYRGVFMIISAIAVVQTFIGSDGFNVLTFQYYTNWSNWLAFACMAVVFASTAARFGRDERRGHNTVLPFFKFNVTVIIFVTFAVYAFLLPDAPLILKAEYWTSFSNLTKHFLCPLLFVLDFVLFDAHRRVRASYPLLGMLLPVLYCAVILARAGIYAAACGGAIPESRIGDYFPYFFLDFQELGAGVIGWIFAFVAIFAALGYIVWLIDKIDRTDGKLRLDFSAFDESSMTDFIHTLRVRKSGMQRAAE